jgi:hypothetical protein
VAALIQKISLLTSRHYTFFHAMLSLPAKKKKKTTIKQSFQFASDYERKRKLMNDQMMQICTALGKTADDIVNEA